MADTNEELTTQENEGTQTDENTQTAQDTQQTDESQAQNKEQDNAKDDTGNTNELFNAPETYDYKDVKLPENVQLDKELTEKFNTIAKELNLSQKGADKVMALAVEQMQKNTQAFQNFVKQAQEAQIAKFEQMLVDDKEIGGNKLDETLKVANVAYEAFADDTVKELMEQTGLNKHPAIVKMFLKFGKLCVDDKINLKSTNNNTEKTTAEILYPNMKSKKV